MSNIILTCGSITSAMGLRNTLNKVPSVNSSVINTPAKIKQGSCSYSVKTSAKNINIVRKLKEENKITYKKMYIEEKFNKGSVLRDLS